MQLNWNFYSLFSKIYFVEEKLSNAKKADFPTEKFAIKSKIEHEKRATEQTELFTRHCDDDLVWVNVEHKLLQICLKWSPFIASVCRLFPISMSSAHNVAFSMNENWCSDERLSMCVVDMAFDWLNQIKSGRFSTLMMCLSLFFLRHRRREELFKLFTIFLCFFFSLVISVVRISLWLLKIWMNESATAAIASLYIGFTCWMRVNVDLFVPYSSTSFICSISISLYHFERVRDFGPKGIDYFVVIGWHMWISG